MEREQGARPSRTRRGFLNSAAVAGMGITAASVMTTAGIGAVGDVAEAAGGPAEDVAAIVNLIATAETLAVTFYYTALTGATFHIDERAVASLRVAMEAAMRHLDALRSLEGRSLNSHFYLPDRMLSDARVFVNAGLTLEAALTGASLAATERFATLGRPLLAASAARHAASAAQRLTLIGHLAGLAPHDVTRPAPAFHRVADAAPMLAPFLTGGAGYSGLARVPSTRQYRAALGDATVERAAV